MACKMLFESLFKVLLNTKCTNHGCMVSTLTQFEPRLHAPDTYIKCEEYFTFVFQEFFQFYQDRKKKKPDQENSVNLMVTGTKFTN